jgi:hypothetical protein
VAAPAQSIAPVGNLDCNGHSQIQRPLRALQVCADFIGGYDQRGYDKGHYVGHDEPDIGFISTEPHSGNDIQWEFTLPQERPLPAAQSFENFAAFWFSMAVCDPNSFPKGACIPNSDQNNPNDAGSALLDSILPAFSLSSNRSAAIRRIGAQRSTSTVSRWRAMVT